MLNVYSLHLTGGAVVRGDTRGPSYLLLCVQWVGPTGVQLAGRHTGLQSILATVGRTNWSAVDRA